MLFAQFIDRTVHGLIFPKTKSSLFLQSEFSVTRQHEEFIWLHDRYNENEEYAGLIVRRLSMENIRLIIFSFNVDSTCSITT